MATYIQLNECIEGLSVHCTTRRWEWKGPRKHPITGKRMTLYSADRNSEAVIVKAIDEPADNETKKNTAHFHREIGDTLKADALRVYVKKIQKITATVKEGVSGRHGANIVHTTDHTIAEINVPLSNQLKIAGMGPNMIKEKNNED